MITNLRVTKKLPVYRRAQHAARVAFGLAAVGLGRPVPVDPSQGVAAAGFDHGVAVPAGVESRPEPDVKRDVDRKGGGGLLGQASIDDNRDRTRGQDGRVRIDDHRDLSRLQRPLKLFPINQPARDPFDRDLPGIDRLGERNRAAHGQRLRQLADQDVEPRAVQAQGHAGSQVAPATDENQGCHGTIQLPAQGVWLP